MKEELLESEFITYPIALKMKALGFNKPCFSFYTLKNEENKIFYDIDPDDGQLTALNQNAIYANNLREVGRISAPTWQSAFKWFREKHKLSHHVSNNGYMIEGGLNENFVRKTDYTQKGYEEAQEACLIKLIEIVESKK